MADVFYTTWSTPFKLAEVRKAQEGAKAGKTQVSPLAGKQQQLAAGQGLRQSAASCVNAGMGMAGAGQWQPQDVALVATGGIAGQAGSQTGSSGKKMAGGDKALQYRILVHLATSTTGKDVWEHYAAFALQCKLKQTSLLVATTSSCVIAELATFGPSGAIGGLKTFRC